MRRGPAIYLSIGLAIPAVLAACATTEGRAALIGEERFPPRPASAPVEVFTTGMPTRPFQRIARLDAHLEKTGWVQPSLEGALPELKAQARSAGADAIIEIQERRSRILETRVYHVTATAIRYTADRSDDR